MARLTLAIIMAARRRQSPAAAANMAMLTKPLARQSRSIGFVA
jgi:hypothetical protein